ncbi:MAG: leucine-rich repeat domain-containing protein [Lachnospiraceae bacterium]|nr:leucine-rich repeat domain-containing protein [Lachnospiraceae bacterium]
MNVNGYELTDGVLDLRDEEISVIDNKAFMSSKTIRTILLPESIHHIGDWAFARCTNLLRVEFSGPFRPGIFGKDVFSGCGLLERIGFSDTDDVTAKLHALCANRLHYDHLLRSDDVGSRGWYEKWDICLEAVLSADESEAELSAALCGEEDISYDGIGSVDGEMPGESADYVRREEYRKCSLCYIRLSNSSHLSEHTEKAIHRHLMKNRLGMGGAAFYSIFEEDENVISYLRIYLDVIKPDRDELAGMISAVPAGNVYAQSYLIKESGTDDALSDLML